MRAYTLELTTADGNTANVDLRLTLGSQMKLKKKYSENALTTIFGALDDPEKMAGLLTEALNFKGNANIIKDGAELYDLITENDLGGLSGFQRILSGIARESGLLTEKERAAIDAQGEQLLDNVTNTGTDPNA